MKKKPAKKRTSAALGWIAAIGGSVVLGFSSGMLVAVLLVIPSAPKIQYSYWSPLSSYGWGNTLRTQLWDTYVGEYKAKGKQCTVSTTTVRACEQSIHEWRGN